VRYLGKDNGDIMEIMKSGEHMHKSCQVLKAK
jgi:hypothetical protein